MEAPRTRDGMTSYIAVIHAASLHEELIRYDARARWGSQPEAAVFHLNEAFKKFDELAAEIALLRAEPVLARPVQPEPVVIDALEGAPF